jgi:hypothetical protein
MNEFGVVLYNWGKFITNTRQNGIIFACQEDWKRLVTELREGRSEYEKSPKYRLDRLNQYRAKQSRENLKADRIKARQELKAKTAELKAETAK